VKVRIDRGDLDRLVVKLDKATTALDDEAAKVVARGAMNIKRDAQQRSSGIAHAPAYPRSITYDTWRGLRGHSAEIGPDKGRRQGSLGNLLEYGSVNNAPIPHIRPAAEKEVPRFERALEDLAVKAVGL